MRPSIRLGRIFGIEIGLHYSWGVIALLIAFSLAGHFQFVNPEWTAGLRWSLAGLTTLLFFASILAHELSHAAIGKARGIEVKSITLFALGGVANMEREPSDAASEFWMAIAGPVTSVVIGLLFLGIARVAGWQPDSGTPPAPLGAGLWWLGYINVALAIFNMIPGYPLDGGRVLRAIVWRVNRDLTRATKIAARVGQFIAMAFIVFGFFRFFYTGAFGGLWLAFIGWFLAAAAAASNAKVEVSSALADARVGDVMSQDCPAVEGNMNLRAFAEDYILRTGRHCFVVLQNGRRSGLVTLDVLKKIDRNKWPFTLVADVARRFEQLLTVSPQTPLRRALELMAQDNVNELPVVSNGELVGFVSRGHVVEFMQAQQELKAA
jgi:Zn-dependent protease/predicted transcriptional regulator